MLVAHEMSGAGGRACCEKRRDLGTQTPLTMPFSTLSHDLCNAHKSKKICLLETVVNFDPSPFLQAQQYEVRWQFSAPFTHALSSIGLNSMILLDMTFELTS